MNALHRADLWLRDPLGPVWNARVLRYGLPGLMLGFGALAGMVAFGSPFSFLALGIAVLIGMTVLLLGREYRDVLHPKPKVQRLRGRAYIVFFTVVWCWQAVFLWVSTMRALAEGLSWSNVGFVVLGVPLLALFILNQLHLSVVGLLERLRRRGRLGEAPRSARAQGSSTRELPSSLR